jgi:hypothetical protein
VKSGWFANSVPIISMKDRMHCHPSPMSRFHRAVASCAFVLALPAVMMACGGRDVALDEDQPIEPDVIEPGVSVVAEDQLDVAEVVVDEEHLVWRSRSWVKYNADYRPSYVRGCRKDDCVPTTITYTFGEIFATGEIFANVLVNDGTVYWKSREVTSTYPSIVSCPARGCIDSPRTVLSGMSLGSIAIDEKHIYWASTSDSAVLRHSIAGESKVEAVALNLLAGHVIVGDTHVYWDESLPVTPAPERVIRRAPKTGHELPHTLVEDQARGALAIDDKFIYWTADRAGGAIFRCPLSGCEGAPTLLIADQQRPTALVTDGRTMTWVNVVGPGRGSDIVRGSVLHCDVEACAATLQTWSTQTFMYDGISLAADGSDVYWIAIRSDELVPSGAFFRGTIYRHAK